MTEENHLENILKILRHDNFDEVKINWLNMYVATRGLIENYYRPDGELLDKHIKEDVDKFLASLDETT